MLKYFTLEQMFHWKMGAKGQIFLMQLVNRDRPIVQRVAHLYEHWSSLTSRKESWTTDRATDLPHLMPGGTFERWYLWWCLCLCLMIYFTNKFSLWAHDHATRLPHLTPGGGDLRSDQRPRFSFASPRYLVHTSLLRGTRGVILCNRKAGRGQAGEVLLVHQDVSHHEVFVQVQPDQSPGAGSSLSCSQLFLTGERVYFPSSETLKYHPSIHKVSCIFLLFSNFIH